MLRVVRPAVTLPVPDMRLHDGPPPFSAHLKLHGVTMPSERYANLGGDARARLAEDLGRFLAEMHAIDRDAIRAAGAVEVEFWRTDEAALSFAWQQLPAVIAPSIRAALDDYRRLPPDPLGEVYGFFDAHGWNMAYDAVGDRLAGLFDFADSGFGSPHRDFVQPSLISADLTLAAMETYQRLSGRAIDRRRVFLLTATQRLSEFAGMVETGGDVDAWRGAVVRWMAEAERFGWSASDLSGRR